MNYTIEDQGFDIKFRYQFCSFLGPMEEERYAQKIFVDIVKTDDSGNDIQIIGKASIKIMLLSQALDDNFDIFQIFDSDSYTMRIGEEIYDFDLRNIKEDLQRKLFGDDIMINPNICIFERMMILPEYRGLGIGAKFVKDRFHYFSTACGLIVMQPFPLQFEPSHTLERDNEFESKMGYDKMEHDSLKAMKSLKDYYKKIGYITVRGYKDLMFLIPNVKNDKLDAIDLEESLINPKA
ncbi:MAG: hypothetical protein J5554_07235 [Paludibacteraceae bacterium]|nr:hypothetical protein [Paludibacteraceae bacterium]